MKRILFNLTAVAVMLGFAFNSQAQCPNDNGQYGSTSAASWSVGSLNTLSSCMYGGEYRYVYGFTAGFTYSFETCGDTDFDTQITIYDDVQELLLVIMMISVDCNLKLHSYQMVTQYAF